MTRSKKISYPRRYHPMLVSHSGTDERMDGASALVLWERFDQLPEAKRIIVSADEVAEKIKFLQDTFHCDDRMIGQVTLIIRKIFFGELSLTECEAKIGSMLAVTGGGDPNQAKAIVEFIQKEILTIQPKPEAEERGEEVKPQTVTINMPLLQALSKYEKLGNQLLTRERIRVKSQPEPVRPSLLYWLKYYRDDIGVGHHDSVQRGQFLFRSENGKRLSAEERERLSLILKSVEEDFPLAIDTERQEIVFPAFQGVLAGEKQPPLAPANARIVRSPAFVDSGAGDERAKKFIPASNPVLQYSDVDRSGRDVAPQKVPGGLRMGRGMHFSNLDQVKTPLKSFNEPGAPASNASSSDSDRISFSASHIFPAEKEGTEESVSAEPARMPQIAKPSSHSVPTPAPAPVPAPKPNPFHIHPVSLKKKK